MKDRYRIGRALKALRETTEGGTTPEAFAAALGVSVERVRQWEAGGDPPTVEQLERALRVLGVGYGDLTRWMERMEIEEG